MIIIYGMEEEMDQQRSFHYYTAEVDAKLYSLYSANACKKKGRLKCTIAEEKLRRILSGAQADGKNANACLQMMAK